jgi:DNA-binding NtrC family response regulator
MASSILVVEDELRERSLLREFLLNEGYDPLLTGSAEEGLEMVKSDEADLALVDIHLPSMDGLKFLEEVKKSNENLPVIVMTAFADVDTAIRAMKLGAYDYVRKPFNLVELSILIKRAVENIRSAETLSYLYQDRKKRMGFGKMVGESENMQDVFDSIEKVSKNAEVSVLIRGESGTGKELVALAIHEETFGPTKPFVEVNCAAIPENLLEAELFGREQGAYTDAKERKKGLFELADSGTFFLDEIGDMSNNLQGKVLKAIEEKTFKRVGGTKKIQVNTRVIAASNKDLEIEMEKGTFREDLYFRLNVFSILLPPLRERSGDILFLTEHFINEYNQKYNRKVEDLSQGAKKFFKEYHWPGNVRELKNIIERAFLIQGPNDTLLTEDLFLGLVKEHKKITVETNDDGNEMKVDMPNTGLSLEEMEKAAIRKALRITGWHQTKAAKLLGLSRQTLNYRMKKYGFVRGRSEL